jgi:hypothetical protein
VGTRAIPQKLDHSDYDRQPDPRDGAESRDAEVIAPKLMNFAESRPFQHKRR